MDNENNDGGQNGNGGAQGGAQSGAQGSGGASDLLAAAPGAQGGNQGGGDQGQQGGADGNAPLSYADWMMGLSDQPMGEGAPSPRDWVAKAGFKDMDAVAKAAREAQAALRTAIPGENDSPERWNEFFKRVGRPETPEGYEIKAPDGFEANPQFTGSFQQAAFNAGLSSKQAAALTEWYNGQAMAGLQAEAQAQQEQAARLRQEWGAQFGANQEVARRGMNLLGIDNAVLDGIGRGIGVDGAIKLMHKIGQMTSEDMLRGGGQGAGGFTLSLSEAQAALDRFNADGANAGLLMKGDPATKAKQAQLIAQVAAARDAKKANAA